MCIICVTAIAAQTSNGNLEREPQLLGISKIWKSTKVGQHSSNIQRHDVDQYITNISGYLAITDLAPDGCGSNFTKWPLTGDIFIQNH